MTKSMKNTNKEKASSQKSDLLFSIHENDKFVFPIQVDEENAVNITFKTNLSLLEIQNFVDMAAAGVFTPDGDYVPEFKEAAFFHAVLLIITDLEVPTKKYKGKSIIDLEKIAVLGTIILGKLYNQEPDNLNINNKLLENLKNLIARLRYMINEKIEFKKNNITKSTKFDGFINSLNNLLITLNEKAEQFNFENIDAALPYIEKLSKEDNSVNTIINKITPVDSAKKI